MEILEDEIPYLVILIGDQVIEWLEDHGMFDNPKCPWNNRWMNDAEWTEFKGVIADAIIGFCGEEDG